MALFEFMIAGHYYLTALWYVAGSSESRLHVYPNYVPGTWGHVQQFVEKPNYIKYFKCRPGGTGDGCNYCSKSTQVHCKYVRNISIDKTFYLKRPSSITHQGRRKFWKSGGASSTGWG